jgi:hypothetical protein
MTNHRLGRTVVLIPALLLAVLALGAVSAEIKGTFVMNGAEAALAHARAKSVELEEGKPGYAVLLSARPAEGDIEAWRSADPAERGSFIYLLLESGGAVWVAELGHTAATSGRFGVVLELETSELTKAGGRLGATLRTRGEETFFENRYTVDLAFDAPLEQ